ncbi:MAG: tyrosine-type recombinase/integrase [Chloroflexi bacterium]|nr:tyrosine-type recombinase/integrase [Chloroflexota bacterium]
MAKKRGQGEGSVFKRKDGLWVAQITIETGRQKSKYFHSQREARDWLKLTQTQIDNGLNLSTANVDLATFLNKWFDAHKLSVRPNTSALYWQMLDNHIIPSLGKMKLKDIRPDHIQNFYTLKMKAGTSKAVIGIIHSVLHLAFEQAMKWGLIGRNPVDAVIKPKRKSKEIKTLDENQTRALLSTVVNTRYQALFWMAITTGLRKGELLGLKWSDLDWRKKQIQVQRQIQRIQKEGLVFCELKSKSGKRIVVLSDEMINKLQQHLDLQDMGKSFAGDQWQENDLIFPSNNGTPMDGHHILDKFKKLLKQAELPDMRFHDLRHTAATLMLKQGVHPKIVQERLGHSNITMTLNTYSHVLPSMQEEMANKLDELLMPIDVSDELKPREK